MSYSIYKPSHGFVIINHTIVQLPMHEAIQLDIDI